jgi:NADP-dependent 3-hydroxy acid dehydrogenase YdfG
MDKTILITGASSGIGEACANLFAEKGWNVVATMRDPAKSQVFENAQNVLVSRLDVQDVASIEQAVSEAVCRFGRIDVLLQQCGLRPVWRL